MSKEEKTSAQQKVQPLNDEAMKGVLVDGIGLHIGKDLVILEGVISKPRSETPTIVSRMIFPIEALEKLSSAITQIMQMRKEQLEKAKNKTEG